MANRQYTQVPSLAASGLLQWEVSPIQATLVAGATFVPVQKRFSELGVKPLGAVSIQGRSVVDGNCIGLPVVFSRCGPGNIYQVVVVLNDDSNDPLLLSFTDTDDFGHQITVQRIGSLIVRPVQVQPDASKPALGIWLTVPNTGMEGT